MSDVLVKVENVSKKFCRSLKRSLWYGMCDMTSEVFGRKGHHEELRRDEFWALKDVSFELRRGECLGLIGHNGAGKTTLLKMLNGLIKPDSGRITMRGRVGALIALGAGFNPILTGRENIYVNASVLGLKKAEVESRFEEIVNFSDLGEFIDAPVQSYSSGMAVRLGFSVACSISPEILLLDEVLAVGDARFRSKCYNRISKIQKQSAVIFVSHSMEQMAQVCTKAIVLDRGCPAHVGSIGEAIDAYNRLQRSSDTSVEEAFSVTDERVAGKNVVVTKRIATGDALVCELHIELKEHIGVVYVRITLWSSDGMPVVDYICPESEKPRLVRGANRIRIVINNVRLKDGIYRMSCGVIDRHGSQILWSHKNSVIEVSGPSLGMSSYVPSVSTTHM